MKNFVQNGDNLTLTAPVALAAGAAALIGSIFGVASCDAAIGAPVVLVTRGVFTLPKATGEAWTEGVKLYWDNTNRRLTTTSAGNTQVAVATAAAASAATSGNAALCFVA
ncbi:DUF2190 family protein [Sphingobium sp. RAC03]|uniref:DUF2190 family protein n=1 Tax=Sphingobium sp. RAC03 TaxID=1843368 RepID=UPI00083CFDC1|nr:DUF2190 family protein [Sphingobium sp. RAC03]AOF95988.1 hypothetical protein BSY17_2647 [Sphingobium sp. RAC03]